MNATQTAGLNLTKEDRAYVYQSYFARKNARPSRRQHNGIWPASGWIHQRSRSRVRRWLAARRGDSGTMRGIRSCLPHALRRHVQLRAAIGSSRRLNFVRALCRAVVVRHDGLRSRPAESSGRRHHFVRSRTQSARALCDVGAAQRNSANRRARFVAARREIPVATRRSPWVSPQSDDDHAIVQEISRETARRASDTGDTIR